MCACDGRIRASACAGAGHCRRRLSAWGALGLAWRLCAALGVGAVEVVGVGVGLDVKRGQAFAVLVLCLLVRFGG